jgi:hypothetical protein
MDTARHDYLNRLIANQDDAVDRGCRTHRYRQIKVDGPTSSRFESRTLTKAENLASGDVTDFAHRRDVADYWIKVLFITGRVPAQRGGDRCCRLTQTHMSESTGSRELPEFVDLKANADLALKWDASSSRVLHAHDTHVTDVGADARENDRQVVHHEARVDAGPKDGDAASARALVQLARCWRVPLDPRQLFTR